MPMKRSANIRWLRLSYWSGAVLDLLAALTMLFPSLFALANGLSDFHPGVEYRFAMGMGASLMLGWTALLLWADRSPVERRGVLPLTVVPVVAGLVLNEVVAVRAGFLSVAMTAPVWLVQASITALFTYSYLRAGHASDS